MNQNAVAKISNSEKIDSAEMIGATVLAEKTSAASGVIVFILCAAVCLSAILFGLVDSATQGLFCLSAAVVVWLWAADAWATGTLRLSRNPLQIPLVGMILIGAIQLLPVRSSPLPAGLLDEIAASRSLSLDAFATRLAVLLLATMLVYFSAALTFVNNQKRLQNVTATIVIFGFLIAVVGILQNFSSDGYALWIRQPVQQNPFASFINRHHFAALMNMTLGLTLGLLYTGAVEREKRTLHIFAVIVMGVAMVLTTSRGALLSFAAMLIFLTAAAYRQEKRAEESFAEMTRLKKRLILSGGIGLLLIIFGAVWWLGSFDALSRSAQMAQSGADFSTGRLEFWANAAQMIGDYPLLGVGLNAFGVAYTRYDTGSGYYRIEQAHNDYLQVLAEAGIIGLLLVLIFLYFLFRRGWAIFRTTQDRFRRGVCIGSLAGCLAAAIHSIFDFPLRTSSNLLLFLTLAALATVEISYPRIYRRKR
jgi:O-antigen ligase